MRLNGEEVLAQHGPVRILFKDGKPVEETTALSELSTVAVGRTNQ